MAKNVYAWTAPEHPYPPYVSINRHDDGRLVMTVRSVPTGGECGACVGVEIPEDECARLGKALTGESRMFGIGQAVKELRNGERVQRTGWSDQGMYLELQVPDSHSKMSLPYVYMKTADNNLVPWLCSQTDLLASDWQIVPKQLRDFEP